MARFIEEFYYGNIDPQARSTKQNKMVQKEMAVLTKTEELLTNALTDEPKKWFLDFANAWSVVNGESNLDSFIMGFRLGANFAYDAFISTETPFEDLLLNIQAALALEKSRRSLWQFDVHAGKECSASFRGHYLVIH